ncbi:hypothetical protein CRM22_003958, partial [Opisthorchis felineus]
FGNTVSSLDDRTPQAWTKFTYTFRKAESFRHGRPVANLIYAFSLVPHVWLPQVPKSRGALGPLK